MPSSQDPLFAGLGQAVRIGTNLLATLIVGGGLGWSIDSYLLPTEPWGLVGGLILGADCRYSKRLPYRPTHVLSKSKGLS